MIDYTENVDTIAQFGPAFQSKVIAAMMVDPKFLGQSMDVVNPFFFDSDAGQWLVNKTIDYYQKYKLSPGLDYFKAEMGDLQGKDTLRTEVISLLRESWTYTTHAGDLEYVQDKFLDFAKNQTLKIAILRSADLLQRGEYGQIKTLVDQAMKAGSQKDIGLMWSEDIDIRHIHSARDTMPTGWSSLDHYIDGGLGKGELGVIAAPSGAGKSWLLTKLGQAALVKGFKVMHYTYELNQNYQGIRYDTCFTGIEPQQLLENLDRVRAVVEQVPGQLLIKYFPSRTASSLTLSAHLDYMKAQNFVPDIVIVDYADLMRATTKAEARYQELGYIYEELRGLAGELQVPMWTASQTQRSSIHEDVIEADKIAESYDKVKTADVLISLSRKTEDKLTGTARFHIVKNRFGQDGITLPVRMDTARGIVEVYDSHSEEGSKVQQEMDQGEDRMKSFLMNKLKEMED